VLTLILAAFGTFGRLFADGLEQADPLPCEAIEAIGATRLQVIAYGVMPQVAPGLLATALYAFDINLRAAIALGIFGAGGLGYSINVANNFLRYAEVLGYAVISMLLITAAELISDVPRRRIFKLSRR
jgi:phosphonate transport system permease protein